eukprot:2363556-Prymnesium_polylepis.1
MRRSPRSPRISVERSRRHVASGFATVSRSGLASVTIDPSPHESAWRCSVSADSHVGTLQTTLGCFRIAH